MHVCVRREGESGARACANERCTMRASSSSTFFPPPPHPRRNMQRSHALRPRRGPRAFYLASRARAKRAKRLTGDRYLGSVVWLSTETLPRGASSHSDRLSFMENARRVRFDSAGCDCRYVTPPAYNIGQLHR